MITICKEKDLDLDDQKMLYEGDFEEWHNNLFGWKRCGVCI
jgi:hypothetical protein